MYHEQTEQLDNMPVIKEFKQVDTMYSVMSDFKEDNIGDDIDPEFTDEEKGYVLFGDQAVDEEREQLLTWFSEALFIDRKYLDYDDEGDAISIGKDCDSYVLNQLSDFVLTNPTRIFHKFLHL